MEPLLFLENHYLPEQTSYALFVAVFLAVISFLATRRLEVYPGKFQNVFWFLINKNSYFFYFDRDLVEKILIG